MSPSPVRAAGALLWRVRRRRLEVLVVHRPRYDDWSWPKGKVEGGEPLPVCAVREVAEETGIEIALGQPLGKVRYRNGDGRTKEAHYWAAAPVAELDLGACLRARAPVTPADDDEIDEVRWVDVTTARAMLTYAHDLDPLGRLEDQWRDGKLRTWTMVIVRHARAVKRSAWKGGEETRPLTKAGAVHARALVPVLSAYGVVELITSPWERCAATVRPYAEATGIEIQAHPELTEAAHAKRPRPVRELVRAELLERSAPVALCTHRPVLPSVMKEIAERTPNGLKKQLPDGDPWMKTAEALVVHLAKRPGRGAAVVAVEKHRTKPKP